MVRVEPQLRVDQAEVLLMEPEAGQRVLPDRETQVVMVDHQPTSVVVVVVVLVLSVEISPEIMAEPAELGKHRP